MGFTIEDILIQLRHWICHADIDAEINEYELEQLAQIVNKEWPFQGDVFSALVAFGSNETENTYTSEEFTHIYQEGEYGEQGEYFWECVFKVHETFWKFRWEDSSYGGPDSEYATLKAVKKFEKTVEVYE